MKAEAFTYGAEQGKDAQAGRRAMSGCRAMSRGQPSCPTGISASPSPLQSWSTPRTLRKFGRRAPTPNPYPTSSLMACTRPKENGLIDIGCSPLDRCLHARMLHDMCPPRGRCGDSRPRQASAHTGVTVLLLHVSKAPQRKLPVCDRSARFSCNHVGPAWAGRNHQQMNNQHQ